MELFILILLVVFLTSNVFFIFYIRYLLGNLSFISENIGSLVKVVADLRKHLSDVYELERFYGDPTLENLLKHSVEVAEILEDFEEIYSLVDTAEEESEDEEDPVGETTEADSAETT
tara:strand:+ start:240 stop:590 length:351 start_codon:yes stop_codon:yes gene_type:complete